MRIWQSLSWSPWKPVSLIRLDLPSGTFFQIFQLKFCMIFSCVLQALPISFIPDFVIQIVFVLQHSCDIQLIHSYLKNNFLRWLAWGVYRQHWKTPLSNHRLKLAEEGLFFLHGDSSLLKRKQPHEEKQVLLPFKRYDHENCAAFVIVIVDKIESNDMIKDGNTNSLLLF